MYVCVFLRSFEFWRQDYSNGRVRVITKHMQWTREIQMREIAWKNQTSQKRAYMNIGADSSHLSQPKKHYI